jgi:hypothetical protein
MRLLTFIHNYDIITKWYFKLTCHSQLVHKTITLSFALIEAGKFCFYSKKHWRCIMKKKVFFTPFGKKVLTTSAMVIITISIFVAYTIMVHYQMNLIRADGGHWAVSATEKTVDDLPVIVWKKIGD